jgi:signal transduction histidine kinase
MDLRDAIDQAIEFASHSMQQRQVRCIVDGPDSMSIQADALLIGQALLNLLLNSAEAMEPDGQVRIRFGSPPEDSDARQFHLVVHDSGPGIPPQILDRIFNPFFTTKETGTGLGLAIVHRVVEAHDGTIIVTNPETGGARFELRI